MFKMIGCDVVSPKSKHKLFVDGLWRFQHILLPKYEAKVREVEGRIYGTKKDRLYRCRNILVATRLKIVSRMADFSDHMRRNRLGCDKLLFERVRKLVTAITQLIAVVDGEIGQADDNYAREKHSSKLAGDRGLTGFRGFPVDRELTGPDDIEFRQILRKRAGL